MRVLKIIKQIVEKIIPLEKKKIGKIIPVCRQKSHFMDGKDKKKKKFSIFGRIIVVKWPKP